MFCAEISKRFEMDGKGVHGICSAIDRTFTEKTPKKYKIGIGGVSN
jgi:hypothetical protein